MHELRPYQRAAIDALYQYWAEGGGNGLIELATGTGKSLVAATLCKELLTKWPDLRIGVVTHVKELIQQNATEMLRAWPQAPIGIYSAGLGRRDRQSRILFCGIQSVWNKTDRLGKFDLLIVDEAHLIPRASDTMYGKFIEASRDAVQDMRLVGLTATPYRLDSGRLDRGEGKLFDQVVYAYGIGQGVKDGYLAPLVSKAMLNKIDVSGVEIRQGEFVAGSLQSEIIASGNVPPACAEIIQYGADRRAWIVFCTGVAHAHEVKDELNRRGVTTAAVTGETEAGERDRLIKAFRAGHIRCLTGVNILTTGFNVPQVDLIAWMRPTLSTGLYVQGTGRGTRLSSGKKDCLVLDFAGNIRRHGPVDAIDIADRDSGNGDRAKVKPDTVRAKECPGCHSLVGLNTLTCPDCGHLWPTNADPKHEGRADEQAVIMASTAVPKWLTVTDVFFARHEKVGKPASMRVNYYCRAISHARWVCFEHEGFARDKAVSWWCKAGGDNPAPDTVNEALGRTDELRRTSEILVRPSGKFFEIVGEKFSQEMIAAPF